MTYSRTTTLKASLALLEVMLDDERYSARTIVLIDKAAIAVETLLDEMHSKPTEPRIGARGRASAD